jgi:hypothetical protein
VHRGVVVVVVLVVLAASGCSSGGSKKSGPGGKPASCALIADLDTTVASVAKADVSDPDAFNATLNTAIKKYVATVSQLKGVTPASLQSDLDRLIAAVDQERFDDAADARAALDEYALTTCGRPLPTIAAPTSTSVGASSSTTAPASTTRTTAPPT